MEISFFEKFYFGEFVFWCIGKVFEGFGGDYESCIVFKVYNDVVCFVVIVNFDGNGVFGMFGLLMGFGFGKFCFYFNGFVKGDYFVVFFF